MGALLNLFGPILGFGEKVIDKFIPDPQKAMEAKLEMAKMIQDADVQGMAIQMQAIVAETKSESWITRSWRPMVMLMFAFIVGNNYIIAPYAQAMFHVAVALPVPEQLWSLLSLGLGGYVVGRSAEKIVPNIVSAIREIKK